jgi:hypothetical protein
MLEITKELILPIILVLIPIISLHIENKRLKKKNIELKEEVKDASISLEINLEILNYIQEIASKILKNTNTDRFLILTATNGKTDLKYANAIYEHHDISPKINLSVGATLKYKKFKFDSAYKEMLKQSEQWGMVSYDVNKMDGCDLKDIYNSEGVLFSNIFFLIRTKIDEDNDRMFYCSVGTHGDKPFTQAETMIMRAHLNGLRTRLQEMI